MTFGNDLLSLPSYGGFPSHNHDKSQDPQERWKSMKVGVSGHDLDEDVRRGGGWGDTSQSLSASSASLDASRTRDVLGPLWTFEPATRSPRLAAGFVGLVASTLRFCSTWTIHGPMVARTCNRIAMASFPGLPLGKTAQDRLAIME